MNFKTMFRHKQLNESSGSKGVADNDNNNGRTENFGMISEQNLFGHRSIRRSSANHSFRRFTPVTSSLASITGYYSTDDSGDDDYHTSSDENNSEDDEDMRTASSVKLIATRNRLREARKESIASLLMRVPDSQFDKKIMTSRDRFKVTRSRARLKTIDRRRNTTPKTLTMLASDRSELDSLFEQAENDALEEFKIKLSDAFEKNENELSTAFLNWETALQNKNLEEDPVSQLQNCLKKLDSGLQDAIHKIEEALRPAYNFRSDERNVIESLQRMMK
jgi:hypothetical protein